MPKPVAFTARCSCVNDEPNYGSILKCNSQPRPSLIGWADDVGRRLRRCGSSRKNSSRHTRIALIRFLVGVICLADLYAPAASCQSAIAAPSNPSLSAGQLDALVAPIALYPDPLVAQVLMAATYPLEVVEADRWLQVPANAGLTGDDLTTAVQQQGWDPSVKSLAAFPLVLHTMDNNLDWTERLGDAFLAQGADVMDAVQRLRRQAQTQDALASTSQQTVADQDQQIVVEPANPDMVYIPTYDPRCVYGVWPYPDDPPVSFGTPSGDCGTADADIDFGNGLYSPFSFWAWGALDWRAHHISIDRARFQQFHGGHEPTGDIWQHDPTHRRGIPYRNEETAARLLGPGAAATRRDFRGFAPAQPLPANRAPLTERPAAPVVLRGAIERAEQPPPAPSAFGSFGRGAQVRSEAARGFSSRMAPVASAPSLHAAPAPVFHGGAVGGRR
jgi:hypothetical protein